MKEKQKENKLRNELKEKGYLLRKSRANEGVDNLGGYMVVDANTNAVLAGSRYELSLEDVEKFLNE